METQQTTYKVKNETIFLIVVFLAVFLFSGCTQENISPENGSVVEEDKQEKTTTGNKVEYKIVKEEDLSYAGCKRVTIKITVPDVSKQEDVDYTMQRIINIKKSTWDDITVWAYKSSEEESIDKIGYTMGMKEYSNCE